ncbi:MAG: DUF3341 domain-containing protein [Bacteroidota bacterium]
MATATTDKNILYGLYNDEEILLVAVKKAMDAHLNIYDVFTPFPVHGLDPILGLAESRLHIAGFVYGAIGTLTAFGVMTWVFTRDWPIIFGGKPYWSVPAFIPITFELTVLFAAIGMVVSFYTVCGLGPGVTNETLDDRITDDKFCIAFNTNGMSDEEVDGLRTFFNKTGAEEVNSKVLH